MFEKQKQESKIKKEEHADWNYLAWRTRDLSFSEIPLSQVVSMVNRAYHSNIELSDELKNCLFTGSFKDQSLHSIIEVLAVAYTLDTDSTGHSVILTGKGCK